MEPPHLQPHGQQQQPLQQHPPAVFYCQLCRAKLTLTGAYDGAEQQQRQPYMGASVFDSSKIDESFIVLDSSRRQAGAGLGGGMQLPMPGTSDPSGRSLEESFVVLGSASLLRPPHSSSNAPASAAASTSGTQGAPTAYALNASASGPGQPQAGAAAGAGGLDAKLQALSNLFELASSTTHVDHPLCLDCCAQLREEMDAQVADAESEIAAYSTALERLEREPAQALSPDAFKREMAALAADEATSRARADAAAAELAKIEHEAASLAAIGADVDALETRHWHDFNAYQLALRVHMGERDALLNAIDRAGQRLALLRVTNVLNDVFKIWHDGPFGTISGFRLGRTGDVPVEWTEINAAWGQAVLLLQTMAQACRLTFSAYRLLPMGSHPRVADKRSTYDLFGPVNKLWSANYDRAMVCFLACLREFGECARARDVAEGREKPFEFPFPIEADKVGAYTIKLTLNKDAKWTKALKLMLADLKVALQWMVRRDAAASAVATLPALGQEGPALLQT